MKNLAVSMLAMASIAAMVSCSSNNDPVDEVASLQGKTPIEFKTSIIGVETKAMTGDPTKFDADDKIGITMYTGTTVPTAAALGNPQNQNVAFTVGADRNSLSEAASEKTMFWTRKTKHYFYAYYPMVESDANYTRTPASNSNAEKITVKVPTTGNTTDLLMGKIETGLEFTGGEITGTNIAFTHKLSQIKFILKKDASFKGNGNLTAISISLDKDQGVIDMVGQNVTAEGNAVTITKTDITGTTINENTSNESFSSWTPIVIPTSIISELTLTIDGTAITASNINATFASGSTTTITLTLKGSGISELTSGITDWNNQAGTGDII